MPVREKKLPRSFYNRGADLVASDLLGKIIVHNVHRRELRARIVETEAYIGPHDLACHAAKGRTNRTEVMFGPAGHAYVYLIYGMYDMFNIVCSKPGDAQAVLIRAAEPLANIDTSLSGPGRFACSMSVTRRDNAIDLTADRLYLLDDGYVPAKILRTPRIGVDYAGKWKDELLRYIIPDNPHVSSLPRRNKLASAK
ncbi:MAG TPA: DNA-3-methyladenine glycosylase [Tepidisphaeraceae bacterium]|jgi:DNA-3-methyladenine glycosylase|nr:DNA-3-methyladenine glycosylase [Tepidisphaeraceae bacterium]